MSRLLNEEAITEYAAIGIMALLIHELENVTIRDVLPVGSGGDYAIHIGSAKEPSQVEVSGLLEDPRGSKARYRLRKKCEQVLTHSPTGYASVTTFRYSNHNIVHSYLHYVEAKPRRTSGKRKKRK